jgi:H+/gluconate symporter-like permease
MFGLHPLIILVVGIVTVVLMITALRMNAFVALITAAVVVSLLAPGDLAGKIGRVATAFGNTAGSIGIVIALAVVIGKCMMDSGAADRIVRGFLSLLGEKRSSTALMASGFVLSVPVFFDTVFYLLVPLARSMHRRTGKHYIKYAMAIAAGGVITHSLVPPTPGPLIMADNLGIDIGAMIMFGALVALPAAIVGMSFSAWVDRRTDIPMRPLGGELSEPEPFKDHQLPGLLVSLLPIILPVLLVSANTIVRTIADAAREDVLQKGEILDWPRFCTKLNKIGTDEETEPARRISGLLATDVRSAIAEAGTSDPALQVRVKTEISRLVGKSNFFLDRAFIGVPLSDDAKRLLDRGMRGLPKEDVDRFKKNYREKAFVGMAVSVRGRELIARSMAELKKEEVERFNWLMLEAAFHGQLRRTPQQKIAGITAVLGDVNLAMLVSAAIAVLTLKGKRALTNTQLAKVVEVSLMSGGMIILITAAGGAFGAMLKDAQIGPAIENLLKSDGGQPASGLLLLILGALIASVMKVAQGSTTVAMITSSAMIAAMVPSTKMLGYHPAYLATAIGGGSMIGSWMNDSGFWVFVKMTGLTEGEGIKSWTPLLAVVGFAGVVVSFLLAVILPMA